ncbi:MAG: restriction endonuclease, partial [Treponema sp.]|nr:restriction endonuclease [Treponema sp.]
NLKGYPLEDLVADLLGAMGYKVTQSSKGGDRGIDIIIYKDELPPRIVVQVKSFDRDVPERDVQALKGAMNNNDYGLFVTLSDYSENAKKYLNGHTEIRGIDGRELVDLLLQYYDKLSDKYRTIIPLKRVYIPDVKE